MYKSRFLGRLLSVALFASVTAFPAVIYQVTVTLPGTLQGTDGIVNMQFSTSDPSTPDANATVTAFSGVVFGAVETPIGPVTGNLATSVFFPTNAGLSDFAQNVTFGSSFEFLLSLDGPAITSPNNGPAGTRFSLLLFEPAFANPLITQDGLIGTVDINPDGSLVPDGVSGRDYSVTFDLVDIPEPATWSLCAGVLLVLCLARKRLASVRG